MMWISALILLSIPVASEVSVHPLSGNAQSGTLVALDSQHVELDVAGTRRRYLMRELLTLAVHQGAEDGANPADTFLELVDGSRIAGTAFRVTDQTAQLRVSDRTLQFDTQNILSVRFHAPSADLETQWQEIVTSKAKGDVAVFRRSSTALDQLEGVFHDVTDETVDFDYNDQRFAVKRVKLEGMIYYHAAGRQLPDSLCVVCETGGTRWQTRTLQYADGQLTIETPCGMPCRIPWTQIAQLDFSSGNVTYLSDLQFDLVECTPYFASRLSPETIRQLYAPRRDASFEGPGLYVAGDDGIEQFDKGLSIHSRSELVFRLNEPYRRFTALAGLDSRLQGRGNLVLIISGDDRELYRQAISGSDPPRALDLDIQGVQRLKIRVDFGQSLDVADHLNLCNARITK